MEMELAVPGTSLKVQGVPISLWMGQCWTILTFLVSNKLQETLILGLPCVHD